MTYRLLLRHLPQISSTRSQCLLRSSSSLQQWSISNLQNSQPNFSRQLPSFRAYRATRVRSDDADDDKEKAAGGGAEATEKTPEEGDNAAPVTESTLDGDEFTIPKYADRPENCPVWQNPQHHNNPEMEKMFTEDFPEGEMPMLPLPPLDGRTLAHIEVLADDILHLNMLEMHELVEKVQEHFGWSNQDLDGGMMMGGGGGGEAEVAAVVEEKTTFDLKLLAFDPKSKIKVIKEVRSIAGLGLKEAKDLVEGAPKIIKKDMKKEEAEELKAKLEEIGATIEIV
jgi:large subunit ribosomal protein L7/L12